MLPLLRMRRIPQVRPRATRLPHPLSIRARHRRAPRLRQHSLHRPRRGRLKPPGRDRATRATLVHGASASAFHRSWPLSADREVVQTARGTVLLHCRDTLSRPVNKKAPPSLKWALSVGHAGGGLSHAARRILRRPSATHDDHRAHPGMDAALETVPVVSVSRAPAARKSPAASRWHSGATCSLPESSFSSGTIPPPNRATRVKVCASPPYLPEAGAGPFDTSYRRAQRQTRISDATATLTRLPRSPGLPYRR